MHDHLTWGGWIFLIAAWCGIVFLNIYCFWNISKEKEEEIAEPTGELDRADM